MTTKKSNRDWSLLEATQESLREHMAEIQRLRAALAQPARVPLTDEQVFGSDAIMEVNAHAGLPMRWLMELTRAIEAAHGIGITAKEAP